MKTVMLYGYLGQQFGRVHRYDVKTPAEAIRALCATVQGFKKAIQDESFYKVIVGGDNRGAEGLHDPFSDKESFRVVPVIQGANGFGQILAGVALVALSFYLPGASAAIGTFSASSFAGAVGASLILGGISQLLFAPQASRPDETERPENRPSFFFNGAVNTSRQGNAVPVCYGQMLVGSQVISSGLSVEQF